MSLSILWYELNFSIEFLLNESGSPSRYWKSLEGSNRNTVLKVSVSEVIEKHEYTEHWVIFQNNNIQTMPSLVFSSHISLWLDECESKASFTWRIGNSIADAHLRCRCSLYPLEPRGGGSRHRRLLWFSLLDHDLDTENALCLIPSVLFNFYQRAGFLWGLAAINQKNTSTKSHKSNCVIKKIDLRRPFQIVKWTLLDPQKIREKENCAK